MSEERVILHKRFFAVSGSTKAGNVAKVFLMLLAPLLVLLMMPQPVFACEITVSPDSASGHVGDLLTFTIDVRRTHTNCITPIDDTQINAEGMEIVSQTPWSQISSDVNRKEIVVRLEEVGEGLLEVIRECVKGGDYAAVKVMIEAATTPPPGPDSPSAPDDSSPATSSSPTDPGSTTPSSPSDSGTSAPSLPPGSTTPTPTEVLPAETSWGEAFQDSLSQPQIIALLALVALATVALIRRYRRFRYVTLFASLAYLGFFIGGCLCVLGSLQNAIINIGEVKAHLSTYLQLGIAVIVTIMLGRVFCGWVCPMGAVQNFLYRKETGKKARQLDVSPRVHNVLRYGKYLALVALVTAVAVTETTVFSRIDPFKALFNLDFALLIPGILLAILLPVSLFIAFPWCKYLCPLGAFLGLFSKFTPFKVKIGDKCTNCGACHRVFCDYRAIRPGERKPVINQVECMRCGECVSRCPHEALRFPM